MSNHIEPPDDDDEAPSAATGHHDLFDYLAEARGRFQAANPKATEDEIPLIRTDQICADLAIDVPTFHGLKTRLHRSLATGEITLVGIPLPGPGGWGWKVTGNYAAATARFYLASRTKNLRGRLRTSEAITQPLVAYANSGAEIVPNDQVASDAIRTRILDAEHGLHRLVEDVDRLLTSLDT